MKKYFLHDGVNRSGPFSKEELKSHEISKEDLVWFEGATRWQKAEEIDDLQQIFASIPPPLQSYYIPQKQEVFTKQDLSKIDIKSIKTYAKPHSDVTALLLAADERYAEIFIIHMSNNLDDKERKDYIEKVRNERLPEILHISKNLEKHLDEIIAYLCITNQRKEAIDFYSDISKESEAQASLYVSSLIAKYNLDMSRESQSLELHERMRRNREEEEERKKEEANLTPYKRIKGILSTLSMWIVGLTLLGAVTNCSRNNVSSQTSVIDNFKTALLQTILNDEQTSLSILGFLFCAVLVVFTIIDIIPKRYLDGL